MISTLRRVLLYSNVSCWGGIVYGGRGSVATLLSWSVVVLLDWGCTVWSLKYGSSRYSWQDRWWELLCGRGTVLLYRGSIVLVWRGLVVLLDPLVRSELVLRGSLLGGVVVELLRGLVEAGLGCVVPSLYGWGIVPSLRLVVVVASKAALVTSVLVVAHVVAIVTLLRWTSKLTTSLCATWGSSHEVVIV